MTIGIGTPNNRSKIERMVEILSCQRRLRLFKGQARGRAVFRQLSPHNLRRTPRWAVRRTTRAISGRWLCVWPPPLPGPERIHQSPAVGHQLHWVPFLRRSAAQDRHCRLETCCPPEGHEQICGPLRHASKWRSDPSRYRWNGTTCRSDTHWDWIAKLPSLMPVPILSSEQLGPRMRPLLMPRKLPSTQPLQPKPTGHAQYRGSRPRRYGHRPTWYAACRPDTHPSQTRWFAWRPARWWLPLSRWKSRPPCLTMAKRTRNQDPFQAWWELVTVRRLWRPRRWRPATRYRMNRLRSCRVGPWTRYRIRPGVEQLVVTWNSLSGAFSILEGTVNPEKSWQ